MAYERLVQIINQNDISSDEVIEAMKILVNLDTQQLQNEDFQRIEEFIVDLNAVSKSEKEDEILKEIISFVRNQL